MESAQLPIFLLHGGDHDWVWASGEYFSCERFFIQNVSGTNNDLGSHDLHLLCADWDSIKCHAHWQSWKPFQGKSPQNCPSNPLNIPIRARCMFSRHDFGRVLVRQALSAARCRRLWLPWKIGRKLLLLPPRVSSSSSSSSSHSSPSRPSSSLPLRTRREYSGRRETGPSLTLSIIPLSHSGSIID